MYKVPMILKTHKNINITLDSEDFERVKAHKWHRMSSGHIYTSIKSKTIFIHNFILNRDTSNMIVVDHINMNPLDNRKLNLRTVSRSINSINKNSFRGESKHKGVSKGRGFNYRAYCTYNKKTNHLGNYTTEVGAARAYNLFVLKNIKDKVALNDTGDDYDYFVPIPLSTLNRKNSLDLNRNIHKRENGSFRFSMSHESKKYSSASYKSINDAYAFRFLFLYCVSRMYS